MYSSQALKNKIMRSKDKRIDIKELLDIKKIEDLLVFNKVNYTEIFNSLIQLEKENYIRLPKEERYWESISKLPNYIDIISDHETAIINKNRRDNLLLIRKNTNWIPEMVRILEGLCLNRAQLDRAVKINKYFKENPIDSITLNSISYRSLQIFGNTTELKKMPSKGWYKGRMPMGFFNVYNLIDPFVKSDIESDSSNILICETKESWYKISEINKKMKIFSSVILGAGQKITEKKYANNGLEFVKEELNSDNLFYWGNIDKRSLNFLLKLNEVREKANNEVVKPFLPLYLMLIKYGVPSLRQQNIDTKFNTYKLERIFGKTYVEKLENHLAFFCWSVDGLDSKYIIDALKCFNRL